MHQQNFKKKSFQLICADMIFKTVSEWNFFSNKWVSRHLTFGDFTVPKKLFLRTKSLLKHTQQKIKKTLHILLEKIILHIISQNFCKIGLNPKELDLLE